MTSRKIAAALCEPSFEVCAKTIIPPWIEGADDTPASHAWKQVQVLRRQRAELIEIFPHKKADLDQQFDDAVMKLAGQVYEEIFDLTP